MSEGADDSRRPSRPGAVLFMCGQNVIRSPMAEAMIVGIVLGTISSIFVAAPLLTLGPLKVTKQDLLPKAKDEAELARRP